MCETVPAGSVEDRVGWLVTLDASAWCVGCAPDRATVGRLWGDDGEGPDLLVGALSRGLAADLGVRCSQCGRLLAEVRVSSG